MSSIIKTPNGYRAQIYVSGIRENKRFRTKREAEAWAAARETELRAGAKTLPKNKYSLKDALERYSKEISSGKRGRRWEQIRILAFIDHEVLQAKRLICEFTPDEMGKWRDARLAVVSPATVLREISLLSAIFEIVRLEWRWINENPMSDMGKPQKPDHREVTITPSQIRLMLRALNYGAQKTQSVTQAVAVCFLLALRTGMRATEITSLTWSNVRSDYLILPITKTKPRHVPLTAKAHRVLTKMKGFDPVNVFSMEPQTRDALFRRARTRAGLSGFTFHDARHTAATWLAPRMDILDLCKMFGWSDPKQAMTYYNPTASQIAARIRK